MRGVLIDPKRPLDTLSLLDNNRPSLCITFPCYNEEKRLPQFVELWKSFSRFEAHRLRETFGRIELCFVNDGSTDATLPQLQNIVELPESDKIKVVSYQKNRGKGFAVRKGLSEMTCDWYLVSDLDLSTPLEELFSLYEKAASSSCVFAFGSRRAAGAKIERPQKGLRPFLGMLFNLFVRNITGLPYRDTQCGFKLLDDQAKQQLLPELQENRFSFDVEMLVVGKHRDVNLMEVPVVWRHDDDSKVSPLKDGIEMACKVVLIRGRMMRSSSKTNLSVAENSK